jgi:methylmalonyl-CoA/ethylmalonyl-CoA epimerase
MSSMKVLRIDHIAMAVSNLQEAEKNFVDKLGAEKMLSVTRADTKYTVTYMAWGDSCFTIVHPDSPDCFVQKDIDRKGEGLHHLGIEVEDLDEAEAWFVEHGGKVGPKETIPGVRREFVVPPKTNNGLLVQVMEFFGEYKNVPAPVRYRQLAKDGHLQH